MIIALRKPKYNITANGIHVKTKGWLETEIKNSFYKTRVKWPKHEQNNLQKFYFNRKPDGYKKELPEF